ncbi:hypothetical protein BH23THE1_BH23THE1_29670 [soil metagenome]
MKINIVSKKIWATQLNSYRYNSGIEYHCNNYNYYESIYINNR